MIAPQVATEVKKRIAASEGPVLSLYLDVNPANPENERRGFIIRAKDAMRDAGVPKELARSVEEQLARTEAKPEGRTLIMFLSEDRESVDERLHLKGDLPLLGTIRGVVARWGRPYLTPLLLATNSHKRYGIVHITVRSWRFFETYLGEIEEVAEVFRELDLAEWRELTEDAVGAPDVPARGGQGKEKFERRVKERTHRLYNHAATMIEAELKRRGLKRLVVLGPQAPVAQFVDNLPKHLSQLVIGTGRNVDAAEPTSDQVLNVVAPTISRYESSEEEQLLATIQENGIAGREEVISALRAGRLQSLVLPWESPDLDQELYRCSVDGSLYTRKSPAESGCNGGSLETVRLGDALPDLATENGTDLVFLVGDSRNRLIGELGGVAGVPRWHES
ncbi:MAG: VLRF1 family aeRF1-type release factor [bacterium]